MGRRASPAKKCLAGAALAAFACLRAPSPAAAGAWLPEEGHGEVIVTTVFDEANDKFDAVGHFTPSPRYRSLQAVAYVDYGVTDWLAAMVKPSLQTASQADQHYTGLGDSEIGARARLWRDDASVASVAASAILPTAIGPARRNFSAPGAGFDLRLLLGKNFSLGALPGFIDVQGGGRVFDSPAPDEAHADLTAGLYVTPRMMILAQSFNCLSGPSRNPAYPRWAQSKAQLSGVYSLDADWRVQAGGFLALAGRDATREYGAVLALWRRF